MRVLFSAFLLLFSSQVWAWGNSCSTKGQSDFSIYFDISGRSWTQGIELEQPGRHEDFWLLATGSWLGPELLDSALRSDSNTHYVDYEGLISYDASQGLLRYYRRSAGSTQWGNPIDSSYRTLHNGNLTINEYLSGVNSIRCETGLPDLEPRYSNDPVYEFGVASCTSTSSCTINFNKNYSVTPLVFVMPTIDPTRNDNDIPATLSITSVSKDSATFIQEIPDVIPSGTSLLMEQVSYLVIEPGVANFNGHRIYADYAVLDNVSSVSVADTVPVYFSQIPGFTSFNAPPMVLGQVQSRNNGSQWLTTAIRDIRRDSVEMSLEASRSFDSGHFYQAERVAFLATLPYKGSADGYNVQFNKGQATRDTLRNNTGNKNHVKDSCDVYTTTGLSSLTGIIANKQTRDGPDGGWLRRCEMVNNRASFVVEEDILGSSRRHVDEQVAYFAFHKLPPQINTCDFFPAPAQAWYKQGTTPSSSDRLQLGNPKNGDFHINGWPKGYKVEQGRKSYINTAFDNVTDYSYSSTYTCEQGHCKNGLSSLDKVAVDLDIDANFPSGSLTIEGHHGNNSNSYRRVCNGSSDFCRYSTSSSQVTIQILKGMDSLNVTNFGGESVTIVFPAQDDFRLRSYTVDTSPVTTRFSDKGNYTFERFVVNTSGNRIESGTETKLFIRNMLAFYNPVTLNQTGTADDLTILGPDATISIKLVTGHQLKAKILAARLTLENAVLEGAATAKQLNLSQANAKILGNSQCFDSEVPDDYKLVMQPKLDYALVCEVPEIHFEVHNSSGLATNYSGKLSASATNDGKLSDEKGKTGKASDQFDIRNGVVTLYLSKGGAGDVEVSASLVDHSEAGEEKGSYHFVPFRFDAKEQKVVAGKPQSVEITALACNGSDKTAVSNYQTKKVPFEHVLVSPTSGKLGSLKLTDSNGADSDINFVNGIAEFNLAYGESGKSRVTITDSNFNCSTFSDCPIDGKAELKGSFEIHARPWTFAICPKGSHSMDGTSSSGTAFMAAGDSFDLRVKPIVYLKEATAEQRCSAGVTTNFFASDAQSATVYLRGDLASPSTGVIGTGSALIYKNSAGEVITAGESKLHSANSGTKEAPFYEFSGLYWNEVGSLTVSADIDDKKTPSSHQYLGMSIDTGTRSIGRFFPHHLTIVEDTATIWDYAKDHDDFAYMGQEIKHKFIVQAESSKLDDDNNVIVTKNYGRFASQYISTISYNAIVNIPSSNGSAKWVDVTKDRVLPNPSGGLVWKKTNWNNSGQLISTTVIPDDKFTFVKNGAVLDGPFSGGDAHFGLTSNRVDNVDFSSLNFDSNLIDGSDANTGRLFAHQPDFRYGRMSLTDVGGNQGQQLSIPLKVEYWNGSGFVTNTDDSGSVLNSGQYCSKRIWSSIEQNKNVTLAGAATGVEVEQGAFSQLDAEQTVAGREQYKIWLRQGITHTSESDVNCESGYVSQPWLQYYWNSTSKEDDPSAVVTFGIYRGNDRVIYRGENRFTGQ